MVPVDQNTKLQVQMQASTVLIFILNFLMYVCSFTQTVASQLCEQRCWQVEPESYALGEVMPILGKHLYFKF